MLLDIRYENPLVNGGNGVVLMWAGFATNLQVRWTTLRSGLLREEPCFDLYFYVWREDWKGYDVLICRKVCGSILLRKCQCLTPVFSIIGIGEIVLLPLDVLKIKRQTNPEAFRGRGVVRIVRDEGFGLYRGWQWTAARNAPGSFAVSSPRARNSQPALTHYSFSVDLHSPRVTSSDWKTITKPRGSKTSLLRLLVHPLLS